MPLHQVKRRVRTLPSLTNRSRPRASRPHNVVVSRHKGLAFGETHRMRPGFRG
ncbi:hypothetical protein FM114_15730 [Luteococcus japonicus LSP_Lj1]|uniref:Uncharacterized protein n=1 Tax=Luteococcus japonicus LSP_Lj1 TaxID=1255658 RepID=A0A1R4KME2_9ACTN|nr:hypothetical protein FM114_15730 [Luteococcus japonicus LSP_Lj1]